MSGSSTVEESTHSWSSSLHWQSPLHQPSPTQVSPSYGHWLQSTAECWPQLTRLVLVVGGSVVADQIARNPVRVITSLVMNLRLTLFVFVMMENGVDISVEVPICPQYSSPSISTQSWMHPYMLSYVISKYKKVIFILCPSSTVSVQVYTNKNITTNRNPVTLKKLVILLPGGLEPFLSRQL